MVKTQKKARDYHYRIVEANGLTTMRSAEEALINLGIPVTGSDLKTGEIFATTSAPHPLTTEEWKEIIKVENPRVKKISKGVFILPLKPVGSFIDLKLTVKKLTNNTTMINIAYSLRNPKIDALGLRVPRLVLSQAAIIGSQKIWDELNKVLEKKNKIKIRIPTVEEFTA